MIERETKEKLQWNNRSSGNIEKKNNAEFYKRILHMENEKHNVIKRENRREKRQNPNAILIIIYFIFLTNGQ